MSWHQVGLWVVLVGGILPAAYFTWTWRPRRRWAGSQLDAGGWVQVVLALYVFAAVQQLVRGYQSPRGPWDAGISLAIGVGIDAVLWVRLWRWRTFRNAHPKAAAQAVGDAAPTHAPDEGT